MRNVRVGALLACAACLAATAQAATYYVDCAAGNDAGTAMSREPRGGRARAAADLRG
jgi:hypothetical protein